MGTPQNRGAGGDNRPSQHRCLPAEISLDTDTSRSGAVSRTLLDKV